MTTEPRLSRTRALVVVIAGVVALLVVPLAAGLLRDVLHVGCSFLGDSGDVEPGWICGDGVGLILPGFAMVVMPAVTLIAAFVVTLIGLPATSARRVLTGLAAVAALIPPLVALSLASAARPEGSATWWQSVAPASGAAVLGVVLGIASASVRRIGLVLVLAAVVALFAAAVLQPGLAPGVVIAIGSIAASAPPAPRTARQELRLDTV